MTTRAKTCLAAAAASAFWLAGFFYMPVSAQRSDTVHQRLQQDIETAPFNSPPVRNIGQGQHVAVLLFEDNPPNTCGAHAITATLQHSFDNLRWDDFGIAAGAVGSSLAVRMKGNGAFPHVRIRIASFDTTNCQIDLFYSGTLFPTGDVEVIGSPVSAPDGGPLPGEVTIVGGENDTTGNVDRFLVEDTAGGLYTHLRTVSSGAQLSVRGEVGHGSPDANGPQKVGMAAISFGSNPTGVDPSDRTVWYANRAGIPWVLGGHPNIVSLEAAFTAAETDTAIVTVGAGAKIVVTKIMATLDNAVSVDVGFRVGCGATATPTTTGVLLTHGGFASQADGVIQAGDGSGIVGVCGDGEDLRITSEVPTGGDLRIQTNYFTIEG